jgi:hypothetical protein
MSHQFGFKCGVRVFFWWGGDNVLHLRGIPVVQLPDDVLKFSSLTVDAGQGELRLGLGEPHGWPLGPERGEPHAYYRYLCWY